MGPRCSDFSLAASSIQSYDGAIATLVLTFLTLAQRDLLAMLRARWRTSLLESLQESKRHLDEERAGQLSILPFLCVLEDGEYVDILMQVRHHVGCCHRAHGGPEPKQALSTGASTLNLGTV